ncbi:FCD domain-containing protein [Burkholderia anthina]|uniref:FadR/GntR family transcriptional regulator n=1 Tax=Burkholderia anthina TaxID=179879 RepID=UPI00158E6E70
MIQRQLPVIPRSSLVDTTIEAIRAHVAQRLWRVGDCIPKEAELVEQLGVGRNTVREAVRVLSHSGMLEVRQGDGTYVRRELDPAQTVQALNHSGLRDHLELQRMLDVEAARFAARRRSEHDIAAMRDALERRGEYDASRDRQAFLDHDRTFHLAVAAASHNTALQALYAYFDESIHRIHRDVDTGFADTMAPEPTLAIHQDLVAAIVAQDEQAAVDAAGSMLMPLIEALAARDANR